MRRREQGFTLTEALVAVAVVAALAAALAPAVRGALVSSARIATGAAAIEDLRIMDDAMRDLLLRAVRPEMGKTDRTLAGDSRALSFLSVSGADGDTVEVAMRLVPGPNRTQLSISLTPLVGDASAATVLLDAPVADTTFAYYGRASADAAPAWQDEWSNATPPLLVALRGSARSARGEPVPLSIEAIVGGQAPIHCVFDHVSRKCREA